MFPCLFVFQIDFISLSVLYTCLGSSEESYAKNLAIQSVKLGFRYCFPLMLYCTTYSVFCNMCCLLYTIYCGVLIV